MHRTRQRQRIRWWIIKYIKKRLARKKTKRTWELYSYLELPAFKVHLSDKRKIQSLNIVKDESFSLDGTDKICVSRLPAYVSLPPSAVRVHFGLSPCPLMYNFLLLSTQSSSNWPWNLYSACLFSFPPWIFLKVCKPSYLSRVLFQTELWTLSQGISANFSDLTIWICHKAFE